MRKTLEYLRPKKVEYKKHKNQDYVALKKECQRRDILYQDGEFPASNESFSKTFKRFSGVIWQRPAKLCGNNPKLFERDSDNRAMETEGNQWLPYIAAAVVNNKDLREKLMPDLPAQEWDPNKPDNYQGIFKFLLWRYDERVEVVVDDRLPTLEDELVFLHSPCPNEFWLALLEKALAKLYGSYDLLYNASLHDCMQDLTGGMIQVLPPVCDDKEGVFSFLHLEMVRKSLIATTMDLDIDEEMSEDAKDQGLDVDDQVVYYLTSVKHVNEESIPFFQSHGRDMIRLRNFSYGEKGAWRGTFGKSSEEWNNMTEEQRDLVGLNVTNDKEFWMDLEEFCQYFKSISMCRIVNVFTHFACWFENICHGAWTKPDKTGGSFLEGDASGKLNNILNNPQYIIDNNTPEGEFLIEVTRTMHGWSEKDKEIGFYLFRVEVNRDTRVHEMSTQNHERYHTFDDTRSVSQYVRLRKGRFVIIPTTRRPDIQGGFALRVCTRGSNNMKELVVDVPPLEAKTLCCKKKVLPKLVTQVELVRVDGQLPVVSGEDQDDKYICTLTCEGQSASGIFGDTAVFYRATPEQKPVEITLSRKSKSFIAQYVLPSVETCWFKETELFPVRGSHNSQAVLHLCVSQTYDLDKL